MMSASVSVAEEQCHRSRSCDCTFSNAPNGDLDDVEKNDGDADPASASAVKSFAIDEQTFLLAVAERTVEGRKISDEDLVEIIPEKADDPSADQIFDSLECNNKLDESPSDFCSLAPSDHVNEGDISSLSMNENENEMSVLENEKVLKEFMHEIQLAIEEKIREDCNLDLESPSFQERECVYTIDSEVKLLKRKDSSEIGILSDTSNSSESNIFSFSDDESAMIQSSRVECKNSLDDDLVDVEIRSLDCKNSSRTDSIVVGDSTSTLIINPLNLPEESSSVTELCQAELPNIEISGTCDEPVLSHQEIKPDLLLPADDQLIRAHSGIDQSECELGRSLNPLNEAVQSFVAIIGNEENNDGMNIPLEDEQTLEEDSTYSIFKFLVQENEDRNEFSDVDQNADVSQESQQSKVDTIISQISSPTLVLGSEPRNFISLEAWIDESAEVETEPKEDQEGKEEKEIQQSVVDPEIEAAGQCFQVMPSEELDVDRNGQSQNSDIMVRALSPVARDSVSSEEPRKGKEGFFSKARAEYFIQKQEDKTWQASVPLLQTDSMQLQPLVKRAPSLDLNCTEISEQLEREREILPCAKQHTPLKSLLMEANHKINQGTLTLTLNPLNRQLKQSPVLRREARKEWNSPARLPSFRPGVDHQRKVKGRPQWVPFLCCPSLN